MKATSAAALCPHMRQHIRNIRPTLAALTLSSSLLLSACGSGGTAPPTLTATMAVTNTPAATATATAVPATPTPSQSPAEKVFARAKPSVLLVKVKYTDGTGNGSGFVIDVTDGTALVLTNAHVVAGSVSQTVTLAGTQIERPARVLGISHCDDIALLEVDGLIGAKPVTFTSNAAVAVGSPSYAVGFPKNSRTGGGSDPNIVDGTVSKPTQSLDQYPDIVGISMVIAAGYSGSPLFDELGRVIGMTTFSIGRGDGLSFAIGSDYLQQIVPKLRKDGHLQWTGIGFRELVTDKGMQYVIVDTVDPGSSAAAIGLQSGDIVLTMDGQSIQTEADACSILRSRANGNQLTLEVLRIVDNEGISGKALITIGKPGSDDDLLWHNTKAGSTERSPDSAVDTAIDEADKAYAEELLQQLSSAQQLFTEDFASPNGHFVLSDSEYGTGSLKNGVYVSQAKKAGWPFMQFAVDRFGEQTLKGDFAMAVDIAFLPGSDASQTASAGGGIVLGKSYHGEGTWRTLEVVLYDNGTWQVRTFQDTDWNRTFSFDPIVNPAIHTGKDANTLMVVHAKNTLLIYVNDTLIGMLHNAPPVEGNFGLTTHSVGTEPVSTVLMDNVHVVVAP